MNKFIEGLKWSVIVVRILDYKTHTKVWSLTELLFRTGIACNNSLLVAFVLNVKAKPN